MLKDNDIALIDEAHRIISERYKESQHQIGCAMRTRSGVVFASVHLEAHVGRVAVCAEAIAIGMGAAAGDTEIDTIVAVDNQGNVVAPCGICRELISDYSPEAAVIVPDDGEYSAVAILELLPNKYARKDET